ncbi:MAG: hypothetical protein CSA95_03965 [Bacteroidetes bacterium]|nr:MAG: hypothetical protein CSA95_03965 [Bacteroidota bacterium]
MCHTFGKIKYFCKEVVNHIGLEIITLNNRDRFYKIIKASTFVVITLILFSCSTKKNTAFRRSFHNLNTHYNGYWNGRESFRQGVLELEKEGHDNYSFILPVVYYGNRQEASSLAPFMDKAIEKSGMMINRHSMVFNKKERVKWIDDCYLLIGKAYFYKQEFLRARRTFEYITKTYEPLAPEARLWMARSYHQTGEFEKSLAILEEMQSSIDKREVPISILRLYPLVYAEYYLMQNRYAEAKKHLENGIIFNRQKKLRTRLWYILAQIYQQEGDYKAATDYFSKVIRKNPNYEMTFNARISLAQSYDTETGNKSMVLKQLQKLLKDIKNEEYRDQIYYALAEIARRDGDSALLIKHLASSVASSVSNNYQLSKSSLEIADIYFQQKDYPLSQAYYDTAMQSIPDDYPNIDALRKKTDVLTNLVTNLSEVQTQDSLQYLASLPEGERMEIIRKFIKKIEEEEKRKAEAERRKQQQLMQSRLTQMENRRMQNQPGMGGGIKWYFYNPQTVSFGMAEFEKRWGNRKLEDLWRLSNKVVVDFGDFTDEESMMAADSLAAGDTIKRSVDPKDPQTYLQDIPLTEEMMEASHKKIERALFNAGFIYYDGLGNLDEAIGCFQELLKRYPQSDNCLLALYMLYRMNLDLGNTEASEKYKQTILNDFPDTDYAKIIRDPEYNNVLLEELNRKSALYKEAYLAYEEGMYNLVMVYAEEGINDYTPDEFTPKFKYLKAIAFGAKQEQDSLVKNLQEIVAMYPNSEVTPLAQNILQQLFNPDLETEEEGETAKEEAISEELLEMMKEFNYSPDSQHFYVLILDGSKVNVNATKVKVSDYNGKFQSLSQLSVSSVMLKDKKQMVTVSSFNNASEAKDYLTDISSNEYVFSRLSAEDYVHFIISAENYPTFYKNKNIDAYLMFFNTAYENE